MNKEEINKLKKQIEVASLKDFLEQTKQINVWMTGNDTINQIYLDFFKLIKKTENRIKRINL